MSAERTNGVTAARGTADRALAYPCASRLRTVVGIDGVVVRTMVCASGATRNAFDNQRTIDLLQEAMLGNMLLRRQLEALKTSHALLQHESNLREEFASMAAHELRTPLNTLSLQAQLRRIAAKKGATGVDCSEAMVQRDERMIAHMVRLIDDMRDTDRMAHGTMSIAVRPMDLAGLVERVVQGFQAQAAAAGCALSCRVPQELSGNWDELRLEQVLGNLLTNAIRYGCGKPVAISLAHDADDAILAVRDAGRGIAKADMARIFQRFERAGQPHEAPGLGLGLYISDQIVRQHGGRIEVQSTEGCGSVFAVRLPLGARAGPDLRGELRGDPP